MNWFHLLFGIVVVLSSQNALAKNRLTAPVKIARECKSDLELHCKGVRPGSQRVMSCLKDKAADLTPACWAAVKSAE